MTFNFIYNCITNVTEKRLQKQQNKNHELKSIKPQA